MVAVRLHAASSGGRGGVRHAGKVHLLQERWGSANSGARGLGSAPAHRRIAPRAAADTGLTAARLWVLPVQQQWLAQRLRLVQQAAAAQGLPLAPPRLAWLLAPAAAGVGTSDGSQKRAFAFLDITSQAHRYMNTSRGSYKAGKAREGGK